MPGFLFYGITISMNLAACVVFSPLLLSSVPFLKLCIYLWGCKEGSPQKFLGTSLSQYSVQLCGPDSLNVVVFGGCTRSQFFWYFREASNTGDQILQLVSTRHTPPAPCFGSFFPQPFLNSLTQVTGRERQRAMRGSFNAVVLRHECSLDSKGL